MTSLPLDLPSPTPHRGLAEAPCEAEDLAASMVLVVQVIQGLVAHPADVHAEVVSEPGHTVLHLTVHQQDLGVVIGRKGRTARSLRVLMTALAGRLGARIELDIDRAVA